MEFDHVAINVDDVERAVEWYQQNLHAHVEYRDNTWAMLKIGDVRVALTKPTEHPSHIAVKIDSLNEFPQGCEIKTHRDGSLYSYCKDSEGNTVEWIYWGNKV